MSEVFSEKESVFFVGGTGYKNGHSLAGGCTKAWYDANFTELTDIMDINGSPFILKSFVTFTHSTKMLEKSGIGVGVTEGMVAYVEGDGITPGRYEVTNVVNDDAIICIGILSSFDNVDSDVNIGGAFDSLQLAITAVDAEDYNVWIYTNKDETLSAAIGVSFCGGTPELNTWLTIEGFNTAIGDMLPGGDYYQSPFNEHLYGIDADRKVVIDRDSGSNILAFNSIENTMFRCLRFTNSSTTIFTANSTCFNIIFKHSIFDDADTVCNATCNGFMFIDCYAEDFATTGNVIKLKGWGFLFDGCILNLSGEVQDGINSGLGGTNGDIRLKNCIILNGAEGIHTKLYAQVESCTFYNQAKTCILVDGVAGTSLSLGYVTNSILMPKLHTLPAFMVGNSVGLGGSIVNDYNCIFSVDGQALDKIATNSSGTEIELLFDENNILANPLMVNPANGDYRLLPGSPCLNKGTRTIGDGYTTIGAWQKKQGSRRRWWQ